MKAKSLLVREKRVHKRFLPRLHVFGKKPRNSLHPVHVLFLCEHGGSSGLHAKAFNQILHAKGIRSIIAENYPWESRQSAFLKSKLAAADIIVGNFSLKDKIAIRRIAGFMSVIGYSLFLDSDFKRIFDLINRKFELSE